MLDSAVAGSIAAVPWPAVGYLLLGIALGIYFGAVPGLSGLTGMAILLPFTFGMDPVPAFSFLLGMYAVTTTSDSIPAILIGVPPGAAAQATVLDGYPMAKHGEAARAFGAAFTCSAVGGVIGGLFMGLSIPIVQPLVLSFAKPELFMLGVLGLTMVGSLSGPSVAKGWLPRARAAAVPDRLCRAARDPALLVGHHLPARWSADGPRGARAVLVAGARLARRLAAVDSASRVRSVEGGIWTGVKE